MAHGVHHSNLKSRSFEVQVDARCSFGIFSVQEIKELLKTQESTREIVREINDPHERKSTNPLNIVVVRTQQDAIGAAANINFDPLRTATSRIGKGRFSVGLLKLLTAAVPRDGRSHQLVSGSDEAQRQSRRAPDAET